MTAETKNSTFCIRSIDLNISWFAFQATDSTLMHTVDSDVVCFNLWFSFSAGKSFWRQLLQNSSNINCWALPIPVQAHFPIIPYSSLSGAAKRKCKTENHKPLNPLPNTLGKSTAVLARCIRPCRRSVKVLTWWGRAYPLPERSYTTLALQGLGLALKGSQPENNWPSQWNAARLSGWKSLEGILVAVRRDAKLPGSHTSLRIHSAGSEYKSGLEETRLGTDFQYLRSIWALTVARLSHKSFLARIQTKKHP